MTNPEQTDPTPDQTATNTQTEVWLAQVKVSEDNGYVVHSELLGLL